jgi:hypothetical protein
MMILVVFVHPAYLMPSAMYPIKAESPCKECEWNLQYLNQSHGQAPPYKYCTHIIITRRKDQGMIILLRYWNGHFPVSEAEKSDVWFNGAAPELVSWMLNFTALNFGYRETRGYLGDWTLETEEGTFLWRCWTCEDFAREAYKRNHQVVDEEKAMCYALSKSMGLTMMDYPTEITIDKDPAGITIEELKGMVRIKEKNSTAEKNEYQHFKCLLSGLAMPEAKAWLELETPLVRQIWLDNQSRQRKTEALRHTENIHLRYIDPPQDWDTRKANDLLEIHDNTKFMNAKALKAIRDRVFGICEHMGHKDIGRIFISKLLAGKEVARHTDEGDYFEKFGRYHLVLSTNPDAACEVDGEECFMPEGTVWWLENGLPHSFWNRGTTDRIHVIWDSM